MTTERYWICWVYDFNRIWPKVDVLFFFIIWNIISKYISNPHTILFLTFNFSRFIEDRFFFTEILKIWCEKYNGKTLQTAISIFTCKFYTWASKIHFYGRFIASPDRSLCSWPCPDTNILYLVTLPSQVRSQSDVPVGARRRWRPKKRLYTSKM